MDGQPELDRFLRTDPRDVGCAQAMDMLHIYAELAAAGGPVEQRYQASPRTFALAARAVRTLTGCWPPCATRHLIPLTDIRPPALDSCASGRKIPAAPDAN